VTRWNIGEATIEALISKRHLEVVVGDAANGEPWLDKASKTLQSAQLVASKYPSSAYVLGYDAARCVCVGVLAQQGLRPTTDGGHIAVEQAIVAQFRDAFGVFGALRRGRNRIEYPKFPKDEVTGEQAAEALDAVDTMLLQARKLLPSLGLFSVG
jgi:hypothetical protein